ncbi:MAG: hypothetical protein L0Z68_06600 [Gammaproteobacteria bacterium]|nr:hypothetical protein [Gammaproteobacteria bacterium]
MTADGAVDLHKIGVKFFAEQGNAVELVEFIPIFHRWIQTDALDDLLIDVADYSHVHAGPGTLLVADAGHYGFDETGRRRGMVYYSKHVLTGTLPERLAAVCRKVLLACQLLEQAPELQGRLKFDGNEVQIFSNDRLCAPNNEETFRAFEPALKEFLTKLYAGSGYSLNRETNSKERFCVTAKTSEPVRLDTLLGRLAA